MSEKYIKNLLELSSKYKSDTELFDSINFAIGCIQRTIPQKTKITMFIDNLDDEDVVYNDLFITCPFCNTEFDYPDEDSDTLNFCCKCGQRLDY